MIIDKGDKMALVTKSGKTVNIRFEINPKARRLILRLDERKREAVAVAPSKRKIGEAAKALGSDESASEAPTEHAESG